MPACDCVGYEESLCYLAFIWFIGDAVPTLINPSLCKALAFYH